MFENIFGNNSIKNILKQSIDSNKVSHSYLMIGVSGIGKKMIATEFAKGILCLSDWHYGIVVNNYFNKYNINYKC